MSRGSVLVGLVLVMFILYIAARGTLHQYRILLTQSPGYAGAMAKVPNILGQLR